MTKIQNRIVTIILAVLMTSSTMSLAQSRDEAKRALPPDMRIRLSAYSFDPLGQMPKIDQQLLLKETPREAAYRLIQFKASLTRNQMEMLKTKYKLKLDTYIPNYAYLEKVTLAQIDDLKKLDFFRWSGNYEPAYKISPVIGKLQFKDPADKRKNEKIIVLHRDANVPKVKGRLTELGIRVLSAWDNPRLNLKRIKIELPDLSKLQDIARIPEVKWIDEFGQIEIRNQSASWVLQTNVNNSRTIYDHGLRGENQIIGHIDGELDINSCFFRDAVNNTPGPGHRKIVAYHSSVGFPAIFNDHGTHTAGIAAGQDLITAGAINDQRRGEDGEAFRSRLSHTRLDDIAGWGSTASNLKAAFDDMYSDGARIFTNSWGEDNRTDYTTFCEDIDWFAWEHEDVMVAFASTNRTSLYTPENAKNCLAVDQSGDAPNQNNSDGGNGPTADGRRKPEITAPGIGILSADANTPCNTRPDSGTSMACPAIAAYGAITRQYYIEGWYPSGTKQPHHSFEPSGALIKATLLNSTVDMTGTDDDGTALTGYPNEKEGWGRLLMENAMYFRTDARNLTVWDVRHNNGLNTGESHNYAINIAGNAEPLKITLVWTEPPASAGSAAPVINDLNLIVTAPNGDVFRGNDFTNGQSTVNGTTIDDVNNVEMVLVNAPQIGQYAIQINGNEVNQGNPGQGYALVVTADTEDPPAPIGAQNTLVVRTGIPNVAAGATPPQTTAINLLTAVAGYISEVSYGGTTIVPQYVETTLSQPSSYYYHPSRNVLIEMAQEAIANLLAADPNIFTMGTAATADDIARMVILTNDPSYVGDWATTGPWPYDLPGGLTRRISVSVNSIYNDAEKRLSHALCHQLGLVDLYAYPNVVFAQPHVDDWDIMANILNDVHPMAWSKERAIWMSTHDPNSIQFIPRPAVGAPVNQTISIDFLSNTGTTHRKAIAVGLTPNVTTMANERVFYFVEARSNAGGTKDDHVPQSGVLLYYVNENIRQGEGPVRIIDNVVSTPPLTDAALQVGDSKSPGGTGLTVTVLSGTGGAAYDIQLSYNPPATDNDVNIVVGDPACISPDIWIDSQKNGFDLESGRTVEDRGDQPVTGEVNRIYFRIHNPGPAAANDITVFVRVSEPYHTVGGAADFNRYVGEKFYSLFPAGPDIVDYVEWTPTEDGNPHSCIWVEIPNVFNDVNTYNNAAQQNTEEVRSSRSSPYEQVIYPYGLTNPYDYSQLFYFKTEGLPQGWTGTLNPEKALLGAHERIECTLTIQPPDWAEVCTEHKIRVTSWMPRGDTLVLFGSGIVQVDLRNRTDLSINTTVGPCDKRKVYAAAVIQTVQAQTRCIMIRTAGCTNPPRPNEEIIVRYQDPEGNPVYHTVMTDEYGCYSDEYVVAEGGNWQVSAEYPGNDCSGSVSTGKVDVAVPESPGGGIVLRSPFAYSFHIGSAHPLGAFDDTADANIHASVDFSYRWLDRVSAKLYFGLNQFTEESSTGMNHQRWMNASANIQFVHPTPSGLLLYAEAGPGYYWPKSGPSKIGFNVGVGGQIPISGPFSMAFGMDYHQIQVKPAIRFFTLQLGVLFK